MFNCLVTAQGGGWYVESLSHDTSAVGDDTANCGPIVTNGVKLHGRCLALCRCDGQR